MIFQPEARARERIRTVGPLTAFRELIAENNALIVRPDLDDGRAIAAARSAIHTELVRHWAATRHAAAGYGRPFAVVALGGTGRAEMAPYSDNDFALLFDDTIEGNSFLLELQRQLLHAEEFRAEYGFACRPLPFNLEDVPQLSGKQLNSFLDLRPVFDPDGLADRFRERIRAAYDPFEQFLHVRSFWTAQWEKAAGECERLDRFDIKNDGLRVFLAGVWTVAGKRFLHSHDVYQTLDDPRDLQAYGFLLRIRSFVHSRHTAQSRPSGSGHHPEDVLGFEDFTSFGELLGSDASERERFEFANDVRARLLAARRRVATFAKGTIERELKEGREIQPGSRIFFGVSGLNHAPLPTGQTPREKSQAALSLLLAAQRYGVPIDPSELQRTFRNAGDWLVPVPELSALFYEQRGSLADSFTFLSQVEGAEDRLFPGYARFEASIDDRVIAQQQSLRGALERQKTRALEEHVRTGRQQLTEAVSEERLTDIVRGLSVPVEAALLDADHLAAVKLALKTKRLPLTPNDVRLREDTGRPLHERFSTGLSEIPLSEYYNRYRTACDFTPVTLQVAEFLLAQRRTFKQRVESGINDARQVEEFAALCGDEHRLRALFVFTCADRAEWEGEDDDPVRWFNIRELYGKAMLRFRPGLDPTRSLDNQGYSLEQLAILRDFGDDFFTGVYRQYANHFGAHLVRLVEEPDTTGPRVSVLRDGTSTLIGVAARDYRGLAAAISGALYHHNLDLRQAHLFSAQKYGLALDFFHITPGTRPLGTEVVRAIEEAIQRHLYIGDADELNLPRLAGDLALTEWRPGQYCLRFETPQEANGLIYALTYKVFHHLEGNIFGLAGHAGRGRTFVSVYHSLPPNLPLERARAIAAERF